MPVGIGLLQEIGVVVACGHECLPLGVLAPGSRTLDKPEARFAPGKSCAIAENWAVAHEVQVDRVQM